LVPHFFVYSTCVFGWRYTATLLCYVFLWSMVVDDKLFTTYHLDRLFCSRPKLVIHCYLLKPLLIDRAHSNDSRSHFISLSAVGKRRSPYRLFAQISFLRPPHPRRRRRRRPNYSCHPLNNDSSVSQDEDYHSIVNTNNTPLWW
jgi:hypothetical protein